MKDENPIFLIRHFSFFVNNFDKDLFIEKAVHHMQSTEGNGRLCCVFCDGVPEIFCL